jgi:5-(carboxyamino)imidazole ribonucleotide synthase
VLAVELFEVPGTAGGSTLVVNELAMRPHNSAHWTIEGSRTSQFEQHLRAVLDYPLGTTTLTAPWVVMANLLGGDGRTPTWTAGCTCCSAATRRQGAPLRQAVKPGRKIGHVTALGDDLDDVRRRAQAGAHYLRTGTWLHG